MPNDIERAQRELELQIGLGVPQSLVKGYSAPEVGATYARARELCERLGETPQMFPVLHGLWRFYLVHSLAELADATQDRDLQVQAAWAVGGTAYWMGEFTAATTWSEKALSLYDFDYHSRTALTYGSDAGTTALCYLALALWSLGYPDQAVARIGEAVALGRRCAHPFSLAWATAMTAVIYANRRDHEPAAEWAEQTIALSTEQGFPTWLGVGLIVHAWALATGDDTVAALPLLEQSTSTWASAGQELAATWALSLASQIHTAAGATAQVLPLLTGALAIGEKKSEHFNEAELRRLQGEFLIADCGMRNAESGKEDPQSEAEACFRRAIEIARSQQAKSVELRAATSLAQLLRRQGRAAEARELLAPIYAWFTEGFDTPDLQDAKALLAEL